MIVDAFIASSQICHRQWSSTPPRTSICSCSNEPPAEAVKTNVYGTQNVVDASLAAGVERFVLISTDKAAEPSSILGASKLMSEYVLQGVAHHGMRVASVRFGNVLGSRGSLLDTLRWQLANGLPVTITHPDVTRFFMSIPEAVGLVLEAGLLADSGETYVLDMGEPIRIIDIVERFSALTEWPVASYSFSGLRPGEKLHEVLSGSHESQFPTGHPRISVIPPVLSGPRVDTFFDLLMPMFRAALHDRDEAVRDMLLDGVRNMREPLEAPVLRAQHPIDPAIDAAPVAVDPAALTTFSDVDADRGAGHVGLGGEVLLNA